MIFLVRTACPHYTCLGWVKIFDLLLALCCLSLIAQVSTHFQAARLDPLAPHPSSSGSLSLDSPTGCEDVDEPFLYLQGSGDLLASPCRGLVTLPLPAHSAALRRLTPPPKVS
jgi:hypothetical protein